MKTATAKELRQKTASLLREIRKGKEVAITYRGKSIAIMIPSGTVKAMQFKPIGFGMWKGRKDQRNVKKWLKNLRSPRYK